MQKFTVFRLADNTFTAETDPATIIQFKAQNIECLGELEAESKEAVLAPLQMAVQAGGTNTKPEKKYTLTSHTEMRNCPNCGEATPHTKNETSHLLHGLMSILLFGFWLIVWGLCYVSNEKQAGVCTECGCKNK